MKKLLMTALVLCAITTQSFAYKYTVANKTNEPKQVTISTLGGPRIEFGKVPAHKIQTLDSHSIACLSEIEIDGRSHKVIGCGDHLFNLNASSYEVSTEVSQIAAAIASEIAQKLGR